MYILLIRDWIWKQQLIQTPFSQIKPSNSPWGTPRKSSHALSYARNWQILSKTYFSIKLRNLRLDIVKSNKKRTQFQLL